jgi:hypothetical protein
VKKKAVKKKVPAKKSAPKKAASKKAAATQPAAAAKAPAPKFKRPSFNGLSAAETLRALAQVYAAARANLAPDANDRQRAAYAVSLSPPARDTDIAAAERSSGILFPADYKALLAALDGARFAADLTVLGTMEWITSGQLLTKGRGFVTSSVSSGAEALRGAVPIANLGQPNDWLLYSTITGQYLYCLNADVLAQKDLAAALVRKAKLTTDAVIG